jgi:hypothetical protein
MQPTFQPTKQPKMHPSSDSSIFFISSTSTFNFSICQPGLFWDEEKCQPILPGCFGSSFGETSSCPNKCNEGTYSTGSATECLLVSAGTQTLLFPSLN